MTNQKMTEATVNNVGELLTVLTEWSTDPAFQNVIDSPLDLHGKQYIRRVILFERRLSDGSYLHEIRLVAEAPDAQS